MCYRGLSDYEYVRINLIGQIRCFINMLLLKNNSHQMFENRKYYGICSYAPSLIPLIKSPFMNESIIKDLHTLHDFNL